MADYPELYRQGLDIAKLIWDGKPDEAHPQYDALINRIHQETKDPEEQTRQKDYVCKAMNQMDPDDVKSPGNGTAWGCRIYWDTENTVNNTINQLAPFIKAHPQWDPSRQNLDATGNNDLHTLLSTINKNLETTITDPLEPHAFVADFNRRTTGYFKAFRNGIGKPEIKINDDGPNKNSFMLGIFG